MKITVPESIRECVSLGGAHHAKGGTTDTRVSVGHIKLTYAAQKFLGIIRLPTHPERYGSLPETEFDPYRGLIDLLESVPGAHLDRLVLDLGEVYRALQVRLKAEYPDGFVPLQRRIHLDLDSHEGEFLSRDAQLKKTYGRNIAIMAQKARDEGRADIAFDADIVTGWCTKDPGAYGDILLRRAVPIEDILLSVHHLDGSRLESDEWLVLNREPTGLLRIRTDDITVTAPAETLASINELARNVSWADLSQYRTDTLMEHRKMPFLNFRDWPVALPGSNGKARRTSTAHPTSLLTKVLGAAGVGALALHAVRNYAGNTGHDAGVGLALLLAAFAVHVIGNR